MSLFIQCILCQSGFLLSAYLGMRLKRDGYINLIFFSWHVQFIGGLRGHDRLIVGYAATCAITIKVVRVRIPIMARSTRYDIMWKSLSGRRFSPGTSVSNKTDRHDIYWNIVESGVRHHNLNTNPTSYCLMIWPYKCVLY